MGKGAIMKRIRKYDGIQSIYIQTEHGCCTVEDTDEMKEAVKNGEHWKIHYQALTQAHLEIKELKEQVAKLTVEQAFGMASVEDYES